MDRNVSPLMNVHDAATFLAVHPNTIRRWAQTGRLHGRRIGTRGDWRFTREDLLTVLHGDDADRLSPEAGEHAPPSRKKMPGTRGKQAQDADFFAGGGEMGKLMRSIDWSTTAIGPVGSWPQSLKTTVSTVLNSKFGMFLWWGPDLVQFYNDAYRPSFGTEGEKHPRAMGQRGEECWGEIWEIIYPQIQQVMTKGIATWNENHLVPIYRNGILAEVYWTYTYSPVFDESGNVGGVLVVETETSRQVIGERRTKLLRDLAVALTNAPTVQYASTAAIDVLASDVHDIPFALLYMWGERGQTLNRIASIGLQEDDSVRPATIERTTAHPLWPVWDVIEMGKMRAVSNLQLPGGAWPEPTRNAMLLPLTLPNQEKPIGVLIVGVSPRELLDREYRDFFESIARQIVSGIANATAHEREMARQEELENARAEAETARQRLYNLIMHAPAFVAVLSGPDLVFEIANPRYRQLLGNNRPLDGKPLLVATPDIEPSLFQIIRNVATTGERFVAHELPVFLDWESDGNPYTKYLDFVYEPLFDTDNNPYGLMFFGNEVTEQVRARQTLEESEERFRTLANSTQNLAWMANPDGWIFWYNQRWYEYTGTTLEEVQGRGWEKAHHPDHLERVVAFVEDAWQKGEPWERTFQLRGRDDTYRWFLTRAFPIRDTDGNVVRWVGTNTDITEQRTVEQQKDQFIGIASHELKTPVTSIKGYTQLLHRHFRNAGDKRASAMLDKLETQVGKLTTLIEDLLDATRIESDNVLFQPSLFDLNELIYEIVEDIQRTATKHTIVTDLAPPVALAADRDRIGQVLTNLLTNAIKYSPQADRVIVRTERREGSVVTSVQDFGIGIPVAMQPHVFERFFRAAGKTRASYPGLGLGLYISAEFIRRHGGDIWVESEEGTGTTVTFSLPLEPAHDAVA